MHTKSFQAEIKSVKSDTGEFEAILSTAALDRDGEIVLPKALDPLPEHITIDIDHGLSVATTVGSGTPYYDGDVLKFKGTFASTVLGQEVRTLVVEKHIRHMSVAMAFGQKEKRDDGITYITKATLLNAAITGIPANLDAEITSVKTFVDEITGKVGARNSSKDAERIQGAHDLFVDLGAKCAVEHAEPKTFDGTTVETKSADTNPEPPQSAASAADDGAPAAVDVARGLAALAVAQAEIALS